MDFFTGEAVVVGFGTAYACTANQKPEVCEPRTPLTFSNIECMRLDAAIRDTYSFATFSGSGV